MCCQVDNALIGVKDQLLYLVKGNVDNVWYVVAYLQTSFDLWCALEYDYKGHELACQALVALCYFRDSGKKGLATKIEFCERLRDNFYKATNRRLYGG